MEVVEGEGVVDGGVIGEGVVCKSVVVGSMVCSVGIESGSERVFEVMRELAVPEKVEEVEVTVLKGPK